MTTELIFVLLVLTAYRATRLVTKDDFPPLLWLRDRIKGGWRPLTPKDWEQVRQPDKPSPFGIKDVDGKASRYMVRSSWVPYWLSELYGCPWCISAYLSGGLVLVTDLTYGLPVPWLMGPAVWAVSAWLASREWA